MKLYFQQLQTNKSWKASSTNNVTIIPKNIQNEIPDNVNINIPWNDECSIKKYKFNANPIKHYRKQYVNVDSKENTFSKQSLIGSMDKPGSNIVTQNLKQNDANNNNYCSDPNNNVNSSIVTYIQNNIDCNSNNNKFYDPELNKEICSSLHPSGLVIKTATTIISKNYSSSYRELLYSKNKTFNQNLPSNNITTGTVITNCNDKITCNTFNPSNKKFQTQGPVSSGARTSSLKYNCCDNKLNNNYKAYNNKCPPNMSLEECNTLIKVIASPICYGCINDTSTIRRKRINILN
jgi:hypothetical protein